MEEIKIPPKSEWPEMSITQLFDVKTQMMDRYYAMRQTGASFAEQYRKFISDVDALIARKQRELDLNQD